MEIITMNKPRIDIELNICHQQISYWEEQYRIAHANNDEFYSKSYMRQINRWQARLETLKWILYESQCYNEVDYDKNK